MSSRSNGVTNVELTGLDDRVGRLVRLVLCQPHPVGDHRAADPVRGEHLGEQGRALDQMLRGRGEHVVEGVAAWGQAHKESPVNIRVDRTRTAVIVCAASPAQRRPLRRASAGATEAAVLHSGRAQGVAKAARQLHFVWMPNGVLWTTKKVLAKSAQPLAQSISAPLEISPRPHGRQDQKRQLGRTSRKRGRANRRTVKHPEGQPKGPRATLRWITRTGRLVARCNAPACRMTEHRRTVEAGPSGSISSEIQTDMGCVFGHDRTAAVARPRELILRGASLFALAVSLVPHAGPCTAHDTPGCGA